MSFYHYLVFKLAFIKSSIYFFFINNNQLKLDSNKNCSFNNACYLLDAKNHYSVIYKTRDEYSNLSNSLIVLIISIQMEKLYPSNTQITRACPLLCSQRYHCLTVWSSIIQPSGSLCPACRQQGSLTLSAHRWPKLAKHSAWKFKDTTEAWIGCTGSRLASTITSLIVKSDFLQFSICINCLDN